MVKVRTGKELWKVIKGYDGLYEISSLGRVRAINGFPKKFKNKDCIMTPQLSRKRNPYFVVMLRKNGKSKPQRIHRLVAKHFLKSGEGDVVNHIDGNSLNNELTNLEWCTQKYNVAHAIKRGTHIMPDWRARCKLSEEDVSLLRKLYVPRKFTQKNLSDLFNISETHVRRILSERCWGDLNSS